MGVEEQQCRQRCAVMGRGADKEVAAEPKRTQRKMSSLRRIRK